jgi:hypothetical protein
MTRRAGIGHWHAHEGRHTAVSIMSNNGVPIQGIADTVGHKSTHVTETVYRHVIAPAIRGGQVSWTTCSAMMTRLLTWHKVTHEPSRGARAGANWDLDCHFWARQPFEKCCGA